MMPSGSDDNTKDLLTLALALRPGSSAQELFELFQVEGISRFSTSIPHSQQFTAGNM
jgi:hypothetical protein